MLRRLAMGCAMVLVAGAIGGASAQEVWDAYDDFSYGDGNPYKGWHYMDGSENHQDYDSPPIWELHNSQGGYPWIFVWSAPAAGVYSIPGATDAMFAWVAPYSGTARVTGHDDGLMWIPNSTSSDDGVIVSVERHCAFNSALRNTIYSQTLPDPVSGNTYAYMDFSIGVDKGDILYFRINYNNTWDVVKDATLFSPRVEMERRWDSSQWRSPQAWEYNATSLYQNLAVDGFWYLEYDSSTSPHDITGAAFMQWDPPSDPNGLSPRWQGAANSWTHIKAQRQNCAQKDTVRLFVVPESGLLSIYTEPGNNVRKPWTSSNGDGTLQQIWQNDSLIFQQALAKDDTTGFALDETFEVTAGDYIYLQTNRNAVNGWDDVVFEPIIELVVLDNGLLRALVKEDGTFEVTDKRTSKTYKTWAVDSNHSVSDLRVSGNVISWKDGTLDCSLTLDPDAAEITFEMGGNLQQSLSNVEYPYPFYMDDTNARVALPAFDGHVIPVRGYTSKAWNGPKSARWVGLYDDTSGNGVMTIADTFADTVFKKQAVGSSQDVLTFKVQHQDQHGKLGYVRKIIYYFTEDGGYVEQCKRYRDWAEDAGYTRTLAEKASQNSEVNKLKGVVHIYNNNIARLTDFTDWLSSIGFEHALIHPFNRGWEPVWVPLLQYTTDVPTAVSDGYVISSYDIYTDIPRDPDDNDDPNYPNYSPAPPSTGWDYWDWEKFPQFDFDRDTVKMSDGTTPQRGWYEFNYKNPVDSNTYEIWTYVNCAQNRAQHIQGYLPSPYHLYRYPSNAHFVDCETKVDFYQCYDSNHYITRTQAMNYRRQLLDYISGDDTGEQNLIAGSEGGAFWALNEATYSEDIMSVTAAQWWAGPKPGSMDGPVYESLCPDYMETEFNHDNRAPLWELSFHDCLTTSWRWTEANLRGYGNIETSSGQVNVMWKRDLMNMLYGTNPMYMMRGEGLSMAVDEGTRFQQTAETVCAVNKYTAFDQMVSHEFVANTNRDVQRTTWQTGNLTVTVNLSDTATYTVGSYSMGPATYVLEGDSQTLTDLTLSTVLSAPLSWTPTSESSSPIWDGGFESGAAPFWTKGTLADVEMETSDVRTGNYALYVDGMGTDTSVQPDDNDFYNWTYANCPVGKLERGSTYRISMWIKVLWFDDQGISSYQDYPHLKFVSMDEYSTPNASSSLSYNGFGFSDPSGHPLNQWVEYTKDVTISDDYWYGYLSIGRYRSDWGGGAEFIVDDVTITKL